MYYGPVAKLVNYWAAQDDDCSDVLQLSETCRGALIKARCNPLEDPRADRRMTQDSAIGRRAAAASADAKP